MILVLAAGPGLCVAPVAAARSYTARACWDAQVDGWAPLVSPAGPAGAYRADSFCWSQGLTAVALANSAPFGTVVGWTLAAPPETQISGIAAEGRAPGAAWQETGTAWARGIWDRDSGTWLASIRRSDWTVFSATGFAARRIVLGLRCGFAACRLPDGLAIPEEGEWVQVRRIVVTIQDDMAPQLFADVAPPSGWLRHGAHPLSFTARDNVGVTRMEITLDAAPVGLLDRGCYPSDGNTSPQPCSSGVATWRSSIDDESLTDGTHELRVRAFDPAGNATGGTFDVLVDHRAPAAPRGLVLRDGTAWRADNRFEIQWANPPDQGAPVEAAVYQLCPESNAPYDVSGCRTGEFSGDNLTRIPELAVPASGIWRLRLSLRDAAGNNDADRAATLDNLRLDMDRPLAAFLPFDPSDPTRVRLRASDSTSGLAGAEVEARRRGEATWRSLNLDGDPEGYAAVLDDDELPDGIYDLRARVFDHSGNERTTTTLGDGTPMTARLPIRAGSTLVAGHPERVRATRRSRRAPRYRRVLAARPHVRFGQAVSIEGRLADSARRPRANARVEVLESSAGAGWRHTAALSTNASGAITFRVPPGPKRTLRFRYAGTATTRPASVDVDLRVAAGVTLVPSRERLHNGETVIFRGRLLGRPVPSEGKLLTLQAHTGRGWRTFATPRARGRDGRWAYRYHFTGTTATARYAFRAVVPEEASYPYEQGSSRVAHVLVYGGG